MCSNRLTGDIKWPAWTPFEEAIGNRFLEVNDFILRRLMIGPLAGSFPILSLRTNKADVVVGVSKEVAEKLDASGEKWRVDGRYVYDVHASHSFLTKFLMSGSYALVSFLPKV